MTLLKKITATFFFLIISSSVLAATITAQLDTNSVVISDSFHLTYTAEGNVDDEPDFSPIKHDFTLLGTSTSSNISVINGNFKRTKAWTLSLRAKNTGTFVIPAIKFGNDLAPEVEIVVNKLPTYNSASPYSDFIVELEASKQSAFIQEQIIITTRLFVAQNISSYQLSDLSISDSDTIINPLGKDRQYKTYRGKKPYIVVERQFAIFAQHNGKLKIEPIVADIGISTNPRSRFIDPFNNYTTTKHIQSNSLTLTINEPPANFKGVNWLPTSSLKLIEEWPSNTTLIAGEPITRTITIMADALSSAQIPELEIHNIKNLKQYPDKPDLQDKIGAKGISSVRKEKIAYIPTKAGRYTLPAINIPWWNTKKGRVEIAHISKRIFNVKAATATPLLQAPKATQPQQNNSTLTETDIPKSSSNSMTQEIKISEQSYWMWISLFLLLLWLITLYFIFTIKRNTVTKTSNIKIPEPSLTTSLKYLKIACDNSNAQDTKTALLKWAKVIFKEDPPTNLTELAEHFDEPLASNLVQLNKHLYSAYSDPWRCNNIYELCKKYKKVNNKKTKNANSAALEEF